MLSITTELTAQELLSLSWDDLKPYYQALENTRISPENLSEWLGAWSNLIMVVTEINNRHYINTTRNTTDIKAKEAFKRFLDTIQVNVKAFDQRLTEDLLTSQLVPPGFELGLLNLRTRAALFTERNLSLLNDQYVTATEYDEIAGSQTVELDGAEKTVAELQPLLVSTDRDEREQMWRASAERQLADRAALNELWVRLMEMRNRIAINAGLKNFREYRWLELYRFAYTPEDCHRYHDAIEAVVVPAVSQLMEEHRQRLGVEKLRPWDLLVESLSGQPLKPYETPQELEEKIVGVFEKIHPDFARYFEHMRAADLFDLHNRNNKAPGGYTLEYPVSGDPFSFLNCVGLHSDLMAVLHEGGHCFHFYDTFKFGNIQYYQQFNPPIEFAEVAAMGMELLALSHLGKEKARLTGRAKSSGFYDAAEHRIAEIQALRTILAFLPFMSVVDLFQHWAYTHPAAACEPANCDQVWSELWDRFLPDADWSGFEDIKATGWHRKIHIFSDPFYYIEYGLAQTGALQVWLNSQHDYKGAVKSLRTALALGGSVGLQELFATAGIQLAFEREPLQVLVDAVMERIENLTAQI